MIRVASWHRSLGKREATVNLFCRDVTVVQLHVKAPEGYRLDQLIHMVVPAMFATIGGVDKTEALLLMPFCDLQRVSKPIRIGPEPFSE